MSILIAIVGCLSQQMNKTALTRLWKVAVSTWLYWSMIEGGLAVIAACLPTLRLLVRNVSLSSFFHSLRCTLSFGPIDTQQKKWYHRSPTRSKESHTYIHAGSFTSSTSDAARRKNTNPIDNLVKGNVNSHSDLQGHGIQVTKKFSQRTSIVWIAIGSVDYPEVRHSGPKIAVAWIAMYNTEVRRSEIIIPMSQLDAICENASSINSTRRPRKHLGDQESIRIYERTSAEECSAL